jgi:hypothetical protein
MTNPLAICVALTAATLSAGMASAERRPAVLELYTSEGCSSCPPAEAFLAELAQRPDVLPLSFHVDYWNDQGWRDIFTFADATHRQRVYAGNLRESSVYTPQAIIDGQKGFVGSDRRSILSALSEARDGVATRIARSGSQLNISVGAQPGAKTADVLLIGYLREATSHIGRGENSGRTLQEFNIVRSLARLGSFSGSAREFSVPLSSLPQDATHVAVVLQTPGQGAITGAASLPLTAPPLADIKPAWAK